MDNNVREIIDQAQQDATRRARSALDQHMRDEGSAETAIETMFRAYRTQFFESLTAALKANNVSLLQWRTDIENAPRDRTTLPLIWDGHLVFGYYLDNSDTVHPWKGWRVPSGELQPPGQPTHFAIITLPEVE